jgi:hypothetical protein
VKKLGIVIAAALTACGPDYVATATEPYGHAVARELGLSGGAPNWWWPSGYVPVCFRTRAGSREATWFSQAIANTWSRAARVDVATFSSCPVPSAGRNTGRWVELEWNRNMAPGSGKVDGVATGATLNAGFCDVGTPFLGECSEPLLDLAEKQKSMLVHEFGHVLGFQHEHQRLDSPCVLNQLLSDGGVNPDTFLFIGGAGLLTPYDPDSIMNYCRGTDGGAGPSLPYQPGYKGADLLSGGDEVGVRALYGARFDVWLLPVVLFK